MTFIAFAKLGGALLASTFLGSALEALGYPQTARLLSLGVMVLMGWNLWQIGVMGYETLMGLMGVFGL